MLGALIIVFREVLEAGLIVGIVIATALLVSDPVVDAINRIIGGGR